MSYIIVNDNHRGLKRKTGVTQASLWDFQGRQEAILQAVVAGATGATLVILGDLFDHGDVSYHVVLSVYQTLIQHKGDIILVLGNHDASKNLEKLSAFEFLCKLMPDAVMVNEPYDLEPGCRIIPHLPNQEIFDVAVEQASEDGIETLLCHCNYDNGFTVESDHSLNLTKEQAELFSHVIMGHEHNKRDLEGIDILGSPLPCTIAECSCAKGYHTWEGPGSELEFHETWNPEVAGDVDWKALDSTPADAEFIRVTGEVKAEEAELVVDAVAKFRAQSDCYMVTNSVKIGALDLGDLERSMETDLNTFEPMAVLKSLLTEENLTKLEAFQKCN